MGRASHAACNALPPRTNATNVPRSATVEVESDAAGIFVLTHMCARREDERRRLNYSESFSGLVDPGQ